MIGVTPKRSNTEDTLNAQPGHSEGWAKMEATLSQVDRAKINDCKEDIDTLLVFAGLFSAVLSAFVLVSYQDLKEDNAQLSTQVLERISSQLSSLTTSEGFINSTVLPFSRIAFQPSTTAILVNSLWFSSLVLSLSTASFGILVKQWLREYLAGDFVSPQARLRARHFRLPGLATWKVFEVAAVLPLLLQISLGLFFWGLCLFTADAHQSVGWASFTLVIGWLCFFSFTLVAPIFSPRCPYKTTFLENALSFIRDHVVVGLTRFYSFCTSSELDRVWAELQRTREAEWDGVHVFMGETGDDQILLAADRILLDDRFLTTTLWDSFQQLQLTPEGATQFVVQIVRHRLPTLNLHNFHQSEMLNLHRLPYIIKARVAETLSSYWGFIRDEMLNMDGNYELTWVRNAIIILTAMPKETLSVEAEISLQAYVLQRHDHISAAFILHILRRQPFDLDLFTTDSKTPQGFLPASELSEALACSLLETLWMGSFTDEELWMCIWNIVIWTAKPTTKQTLQEMLTSITWTLEAWSGLHRLLLKITWKYLSQTTPDTYGIETSLGDIMDSVTYSLVKADFPSYRSCHMTIMRFKYVMMDEKWLGALWRAVKDYDDLHVQDSVFGKFGMLVGLSLLLPDKDSQLEAETMVINLKHLILIELESGSKSVVESRARISSLIAFADTLLGYLDRPSCRQYAPVVDLASLLAEIGGRTHRLTEIGETAQEEEEKVSVSSADSSSYPVL